jgi:hypothetical protein
MDNETLPPLPPLTCDHTTGFAAVWTADQMRDYALAAIAPYKAEIERLQYEVVNRNRRALEGDQAQANWDAQYDRAEKAEAEVARLHNACKSYEIQANKDALEIARLKAGGCARNQGLTQYCAEAAKFAEELEQRPSKRLWDETATALEVLRGKFHEVKTENAKLRELLREVSCRATLPDGMIERIRAALGDKK